MMIGPLCGFWNKPSELWVLIDTMLYCYPTLTPRPTWSLSPLWFTKAPIISVAGSGVRRFSNTPPIIHRLFIIPGCTHTKYFFFTFLFMLHMTFDWKLQIGIYLETPCWPLVVPSGIQRRLWSPVSWYWLQTPLQLGSSEQCTHACLQYSTQVNAVFIQ